jgi:malonate-semialdehyde dehydrogenase (acetylating)/methylmalonate-semialdehyde dehydrogenase
MFKKDVPCSWVAIFVGAARQWIPELIERAQALKISGGFEEGTDLSVILTSLSLD